MKLFPCYLIKIKNREALQYTYLGVDRYLIVLIARKKKDNCRVKYALSLLRGLITGELSTSPETANILAGSCPLKCPGP